MSHNVHSWQKLELENNSNFSVAFCNPGQRPTQRPRARNDANHDAADENEVCRRTHAQRIKRCVSGFARRNPGLFSVT